MCKRLIVTLTALTLALGGLGLSPAQAEDHAKKDWINTDVKLSAEQKEVLQGMNKALFEKKKEVITKYVEYGVIPKEKGEKIISKIDQHYAMLEQNGFIPQWDRHQKHHRKHKHDQ